VKWGGELNFVKGKWPCCIEQSARERVFKIETAGGECSGGTSKGGGLRGKKRSELNVKGGNGKTTNPHIGDNISAH